MWLLSPLCPWPKVELVVVMVIVPLILNTLYFWAIDNVLKRKPQVPPSISRATQPSFGYILFPRLAALQRLRLTKLFSNQLPLPIPNSLPTTVSPPTKQMTPTPSGACPICPSLAALSLAGRSFARRGEWEPSPSINAQDGADL